METTIYLTTKDAKLYLQFQKHYELFEKLVELNALNIQFGKCTLNYAFGQLQNVVKEEVVFKR